MSNGRKSGSTVTYIKHHSDRSMTFSLIYMKPNPPRYVSNRRTFDEWGGGGYGDPRGSRVHNGIDFLIGYRSIVCSMSSGIVSKIGKCYRGDEFKYVEVIDSIGNHIRHFYIEPTVDIGQTIRIGQSIGSAQNLAKRYKADDCHTSDMPNHIHFEIVKEGTLYTKKQFINPDFYCFT